MSRLVSSKCPNCGALLQVDPEIAVASCSSCNASSFVQTSKRRAPSPRRGFVIDVDPVLSTPWLALLALPVLGIAVTAYAWDSIERHLPFSLIGAKRQPAATATEARPEAVETPQLDQPPTDIPATEPSRSQQPPPMAVPEDPAPKESRSLKKQITGTVRAGAATISGRLDPTLIQKIVRMSHPRARMCYEQGLARDPSLEGQMTMRFVIGRDGTVSHVNASITFPDPAVRSCMQALFYRLTFPKPEGGIVTVLYPLFLTRQQ